MAEDAAKTKIPVLLLKTKSSPADAYEDYFNAAEGGRYKPIFVPVLEHRFKDESLREVRDIIENGGFNIQSSNTQSPARYGGIIFTSQRAVEAFAEVIQEIRSKGQAHLDELLPTGLPFYVVGPATARGLRALNLPCTVVGEESGNGDALAAFIQEHYNFMWEKHKAEGHRKLPLLFLVGEKRRDIIPKTLQSPDLPEDQRSEVEELEVYETAEMQSFKSDFAAVWNQNSEAGIGRQWVVVFSPTGCRAMLENLGYIDKDLGKAMPIELESAEREKTTYIATIGPTTRDYLRNEFSIDSDVCAETPSAEGVGAAIRGFMLRL